MCSSSKMAQIVLKEHGFLLMLKEQMQFLNS